MSKYSESWDREVRPFAQKVIDETTVDTEAIKFYVGKMIWAVEHDLANGRECGLGALNALLQIKGIFADESYFKDIHPSTSKDEVDRMRKLSDLIKKLITKASEVV